MNLQSNAAISQERLSIMNTEDAMRNIGITEWEKILLGGGRGGGRFLYNLLGFLGFTRGAHKRQEIITEALSDLYKQRKIEIQLMQREALESREKIKMGHDLALTDAWKYTGGAVKELGTLGQYAYMAENMPIKGVYLNKHDIATHLVAGSTEEGREKPQTGATFKQLAESYNAYIDRFFDKDPEKMLEKITALNPELTKGVKHDNLDVVSRQWFGAEFGVIQKIKLPDDKIELNLRDLHLLGGWLFMADKKDEVKDFLSSNDRDAYKQMFTYQTTNKAGEQISTEIADATTVDRIWETTNGFASSMMHDPRSRMQKWIMFQLKGSSTIKRAFTHEEIKVGGEFKNAYDYYNRQLGKMVNLYMGRYLFNKPEEGDEDLTLDGEAADDTNELRQLLNQDEELTAADRDKIAELTERLLDKYEDSFMSDEGQIENDAKAAVAMIAKERAEENKQYVTEERRIRGRAEKEDRDLTEEEESRLEAMRVELKDPWDRRTQEEKTKEMIRIMTHMAELGKDVAVTPYEMELMDFGGDD